MVYVLLLPLLTKVDILFVRPAFAVKPRKRDAVPLRAVRAADELRYRYVLNFTFFTPLL